MIFEIGDWVQAGDEINEPDFMGQAVWTHARKNAIGHVLEVLDDGMVNVFWERSGTVTVCHPSEIVRLCGWDAKPPSLQQSSDSRS